MWATSSLGLLSSSPGDMADDTAGTTWRWDAWGRGFGCKVVRRQPRCEAVLRAATAAGPRAARRCSPATVHLALARW